MFNPIYGLIPLPAFFDAEPRWVNPWDAPWDWFRQVLVPWIVLGLIADGIVSLFRPARAHVERSRVVSIRAWRMTARRTRSSATGR
jgi:hypothetical protein